MPEYTSRCNSCGKHFDYYSTIAERLDTPECCGGKTEKVILDAPMGIVDIPAYISPVSGRWINSRKERNEDFKRTDTRPWEGMEQEQKEAARRASYEEAKQDARLEKAIEENIKALPDEKKAVLGVT